VTPSSVMVVVEAAKMAKMADTLSASEDAL
jgi:hypothetical protein